MDTNQIIDRLDAIIQLSQDIFDYVKNLGNASKDHERFLKEIWETSNPLIDIKYKIKEGGADRLTRYNVMDLREVLDEVRQTLEALKIRTIGAALRETTSEMLVPDLSDVEVTGILSRLERLQSSMKDWLRINFV